MPTIAAAAEDGLTTVTYADRGHTVTIGAAGVPGARRFAFHSDAPRVDGLHTHDGTRTVEERSDDPHAQTGSPLLDGLFALAVAEARENAVEHVADHAFADGRPLHLSAYETGAKWHYVWTRDLAYAVDLGLAGLDADRCRSSLMFKTSGPKAGVAGPFPNQVLQDTGSGGSYPVSTDRVVWAVGAAAVARHLAPAARAELVALAYPFLRDTAEQDRTLVFDPADGLYRGEQSFLDWREQTYPLWTAGDVMAVALSKSTSTNVAHAAMLATASAFAAEVGDAAAAARYGRWAADLRVAINAHLWDEEAGLYLAYLLTESRWPMRVKRYDLLGQALAVLWDVAPAGRAARVLAGYPSGPHGPPVAWPQEQGVPIYHNHAIWPFVTAYWVRAAAHVGHGAAVRLGVHSLVRGAAVNLSNMENMDLATGHVQATVHGIRGPVTSSQRQLWSVAGFVSMVRDTLFGMRVEAGGAVGFRPFLTPAVRRRYLGPGETVALRNLTHHGCRLDVVLHLPADDGDPPPDEPYGIGAVHRNGEPCEGCVPPAGLSTVSRWELWLTRPAPAEARSLPVVDGFADVRTYFAPRQTEWVGDGVTVGDDGRPLLRFASAGPGPVVFDVYRDGQRVAAAVPGPTWSDWEAAGAHDYAVVAVFPDTGLHSHPTPERSTAAVLDVGGDLTFRPTADGEHVVRLRYVNTGAPINTGITCGVKRWEATDDGDRVVAAGYVVMPHTGGAVLRSSPLVLPGLSAGRTYAVRLRDDAASLNMASLAHNAMYTAHAGGGPEPYNRVTVVGATVAFGPPAA